jgi:hypothetical protein
MWGNWVLGESTLTFAGCSAYCASLFVTISGESGSFATPSLTGQQAGLATALYACMSSFAWIAGSSSLSVVAPGTTSTFCPGLAVQTLTPYYTTTFTYCTFGGPCFCGLAGTYTTVDTETPTEYASTVTDPGSTTTQTVVTSGTLTSLTTIVGTVLTSTQTVTTVAVTTTQTTRTITQFLETTISSTIISSTTTTLYQTTITSTSSTSTFLSITTSTDVISDISTDVTCPSYYQDHYNASD